MNPKFENANVSALVKFEVDSVKYQILRDGKQFAIFDGESNLLQSFSSVTKELGPYLAELFNFKPVFQSVHSDFIIPPPAFLFLPFYVDQDESWGKSWSSFKLLQQIKDYRNQSIYYHSGIRPNEYFTTKKEIQEFIKVIEQTDKEQKVTNKVLGDIKNKLSQTEFNIDIDSFKSEITELLTQAESLKTIEANLKQELHDLYHLKAAYDAQINIVKQAIVESHNDLKFASEKLPDIISCPTCGAEYENSFSERFQIATDEQKSKELLLELLKEAKEIDEKIDKENNKLTNTLSEVTKIDGILQQRKGDISLHDIIENAGKNQVKELFSIRYRELTEILVDNARKKEKLEAKLKSYESKDRKDEIISYYTSTLSSFLKKLDVYSLHYDDYKNITSKIESKETGSSRPRALIAYYFTFFYLMQKYSSSTYCPLIVDSPNQQDQDIEHIDKIMKFINQNQPKGSQLILGLAETYGEDFNCKVIELKEKYNLLNEEEFNSVNEELYDKIQALWF
ncbi:MAG: hypothetical protein JST62_04700 [Bacteroidetes bacterium]|nr:hypothetical protein [Bacteroidota bacterium]